MEYRRILEDLRAQRRQIAVAHRAVLVAPEMERMDNVAPVQRYGLRSRVRQLVEYDERDEEVIPQAERNVVEIE